MLNTQYGDLKKYVLYFIGVYFVKKVSKLINCTSCLENLLAPHTEHNYALTLHWSKLVNFKNRGGLCKISNSCYLIIERAEKLLLFYTQNLKKLTTANVSSKIIKELLHEFCLNSTVFNDLNCKDLNVLERSHKSKLIILIAERYLKIRL